MIICCGEMEQFVTGLNKSSTYAFQSKREDITVSLSSTGSFKFDYDNRLLDYKDGYGTYKLKLNFCPSCGKNLREVKFFITEDIDITDPKEEINILFIEYRKKAIKLNINDNGDETLFYLENDCNFVATSLDNIYIAYRRNRSLDMALDNIRSGRENAVIVCMKNNKILNLTEDKVEEICKNFKVKLV